MGHPRGHKPCQQTYSSMGFSLSVGLQVLAGSCSNAGSPWSHSLLRAPPLLWHGIPSTGYRWRSAPPWTSMGCRDSLSHHGLLHGCRETSGPATRAPPSPSALALGAAELLLSCILTPLSHAAVLFPLLKYFIPEVLPLSLMGSALATGRSVLEPVALAPSEVGEASGSFSQKPPLQPPLLPKPCHANQTVPLYN